MNRGIEAKLSFLGKPVYHGLSGRSFPPSPKGVLTSFTRHRDESSGRSYTIWYRVEERGRERLVHYMVEPREL